MSVKIEPHIWDYFLKLVKRTVLETNFDLGVILIDGMIGDDYGELILKTNKDQFKSKACTVNFPINNFHIGSPFYDMHDVSELENIFGMVPIMGIEGISENNDGKYKDYMFIYSYIIILLKTSCILNVEKTEYKFNETNKLLKFQTCIPKINSDEMKMSAIMINDILKERYFKYFERDGRADLLLELL